MYYCIVEREPPPPPPPRIILHDATTSTEDLYIPPPPRPRKSKKESDSFERDFFFLARPETKDTGTTTAGLPRRPLCVTGERISQTLLSDTDIIVENRNSNNRTI